MVDDTELLCAAWMLRQLSTSRSANNDAGVTCVSWILISPHTDPRAHHLLQSQTCLHMPYEMSRVFTQPVSFRVSSFYSCNNTGRTRPGTCQASATCRAASTSTAAAVLRCPWQDCAGDVACVGTLHPSLSADTLLFVAMLWRTIDSDSAWLTCLSVLQLGVIHTNCFNSLFYWCSIIFFL